MRVANNSTKIVYTLFPNNKATTGEQIIESLKDFARKAAVSFTKKDAQPLAVPDQLPGLSRAKTVQAMSATCVFLDFDKPKLDSAAVIKILNKLGAAYVLYRTYSWKADAERYRVVLPLSCPIDVVERRHIIARLDKLLPGIAPETGDSKRGFYVGTNGSGSPLPVHRDGKSANELTLPEAARPANPLPSGISTKDNPHARAQQLVAQLGHKIRDGEGRWGAVEFCATRLSARQYTEDQCYTWLGELIAKYFDATQVTDEDRTKWESRIRYWLNKDAPKRADRLKTVVPHATTTGSKLKGLPSTFSADELLNMDLPDTKWILDGLLPPGLALIAGPPKAGKSQLMLDLALCVAAGKSFLNRYPSRKCKVVFYDLESGHHLLKERLLPTMTARNIKAKDLKGYMSFSLVMDTGADAFTQLRQELADNPDICLVVIDLFARIRDHENPQRKSVYQLDYDAMAQFQDICAEHPDLCILLVHHTNKRSQNQSDHWQDSISGSHGLSGATHTNMAMSRVTKQGLTEEEYEKLKRYVTFHATGKRVKDMDLILKQAGDGVSWEISEQTLAEVKTSTLQAEIMAVLKSDLTRLWSAPEVADALGKNRNTIKNIMLRMNKHGVIKSPTGKGYTLVSSTVVPIRGPQVGGNKKGAGG